MATISSGRRVAAVFGSSSAAMRSRQVSDFDRIATRNRSFAIGRQQRDRLEALLGMIGEIGIERHRSCVRAHMPGNQRIAIIGGPRRGQGHSRQLGSARHRITQRDAFGRAIARVEQSERGGQDDRPDHGEIRSSGSGARKIIFSPETVAGIVPAIRAVGPSGCRC